MEKTESYTETFNRLNNQLDGIEIPVVSSVSTEKNLTLSPTPSIQNVSTSHSITFKPIYLYGGIPIGVLLLFIMTQPKFLKDELTDEKGEKSYKINMQKILIWTVVISIIINIGIFAYFYQQKNKKNI
jgi:heme/copper-type cytochrome/quinol oxidase subunit 2